VRAGVVAAFAAVASVAATAATVSTAAAPPATPATPSGRPTAAATPAPIEDLATRLDLRGPFNLGNGKVRIVAFLSPTCKHCIANAARLQEILADLPGDDIEVHAVWLQILDTDARDAVPRATTVLRDGRVHHYWDPKRLLNHQLLDAIEFDIQLRLYDVFLLYDRTATWDKRLPRPRFWMHEYKGAPGPLFDATQFAAEIAKARRAEPPGNPR